MSNPRLLKVAEVNGWSLLRRTWPDDIGRDGDWLLCPADSTDGPVLVFGSVEQATAHAQTRSAVSGQV
jgi:hypothetical protein